MESVVYCFFKEPFKMVLHDTKDSAIFMRQRTFFLIVDFQKFHKDSQKSPVNSDFFFLGLIAIV